jgi:hypothetical protein
MRHRERMRSLALSVTFARERMVSCAYRSAADALIRGREPAMDRRNRWAWSVALAIGAPAPIANNHALSEFAGNLQRETREPVSNRGPREARWDTLA